DRPTARRRRARGLGGVVPRRAFPARRADDTRLDLGLLLRPGPGLRPVQAVAAVPDHLRRAPVDPPTLLPAAGHGPVPVGPAQPPVAGTPHEGGPLPRHDCRSPAGPPLRRRPARLRLGGPAGRAPRPRRGIEARMTTPPAVSVVIPTYNRAR